MDYQTFLTDLPNLYTNWGKASITPASNCFRQLLEQVKDSTTENIMQLLNFAVECMKPDEIYCQIGFSQGANLFAALLEQREKMAYAIENLYLLENQEEIIEKLNENLSLFNLESQIVFCNQDFEEFFAELREIETESKIGVYFYNCGSDYRSQILALLLVKPFLANQALIITSNCNSSGVQQANWDFMTAHPQCQMLLDLPTPEDNHSSFWNGIQVLSWDIDREYNYALSFLKKQRHDNFIQAVINCQLDFENQKKAIVNLRREAVILYNYGCFEEAEQKYKQVLAWDNNQADAWLDLCILYYKTNRYQPALNALVHSIQLEPSQAINYYTMGVVLEKLGATSHAMEAYEQAIALEPEAIDPYNNLGNILLEKGEIDKAEANYRQAIAANPKHFGSYLNLGNVLMERQQIDEAIVIYEQALQLKSRNPDVLYNLGVALEAKNNPAKAALYYGYASYRQNQYQEAINYYQQFLQTETGDEHFYIALAECYQGLDRAEEAINTYKEGLRLYPKSSNIYIFFALALQEMGYTEQAIEVVTEASQFLPDVLAFRLEKQRILPILYDTQEEVDFYRNRFTQGLEELIQHTSLDTPESQKSALAGIGMRTNFYLQYQCRNDVELQKLYGKFVHQVMAANYPQWAKPIPMPTLEKGEKIRIGYASYYLRGHNGAKWALGWIKNHNRQDFEIYCYHTSPMIDLITQQFKLTSDFFHHIPDDLDGVCSQILADKLHILIFPEIGMAPITTQMAGLQLAPVQCTAWGHAITSGLPTIEYFISGDLMEPENAQEHYSEKLIRLPNIGLCYPKPVVPQPTKTREKFGLSDDTIVYLSCQSLYKYLPCYDYIYPAIAQKVPQSQFAFLAHNSLYITDKFRNRLQRAFAEFSLNSEDYCVIVPRQKTPDYLTLNLLSDVYLDTFGWSGGNSTLEAIACNLPIVTCPGEFMRGFHSYGILKMLGVTDTITKNEAEYIDMAVKLGLNPKWRQSIIERMIQRHAYLYDDKTCVAALDDFLRSVVHQNEPALVRYTSLT
ncbi:MAG: tetratricopeptide repeat protein [Scytonema sp. PMC 1069.18]|nr:tetratricopeptide repeat protein [Scytonema sp. PMC 1069.18]MEC4880608.1 tetratricopeptide repeat protein [Scytonema sp. PMC 1070.18]